MLCTGTPAPDMAHWGSSFLVGIGGEWLMFDCGHAANYMLHKAGFQSTQVDRLFFTHHHSDHDADYPSFLLTRFDITLPVEIWSMLRSGLSPRLNAIGSLVFLVSVTAVLLLEILVFRKRA